MVRTPVTPEVPRCPLVICVRYRQQMLLDELADAGFRVQVLCSSLLQEWLGARLDFGDPEFPTWLDSQNVVPHKRVGQSLSLCQSDFDFFYLPMDHSRWAKAFFWTAGPGTFTSLFLTEELYGQHWTANSHNSNDCYERQFFGNFGVTWMAS